MNKFFLAITAFWICAISINAQVGRPFPTRLDDFHKYTTTPSNVTTETLKCSSNSNLYIKIDIHREYGIPRYGIIIDCHQNVDTVSYISNNFVRPQGGGIPSPWLKDSNITIWWKEGNFNVKIMDILTGTIVLDETHNGQSANEFDKKIDTVKFKDSSTTLVFEGGTNPKKSTNPGVTIDFKNIPNGFYWVYIIGDNNIIWYMNTFKKEI